MVDISPNFGVKTFDSQEEAVEYLRKLGFTLLLRRSDYDVYETVDEPKKRATVHQDEEGRYFVGQHVER